MPDFPPEEETCFPKAATAGLKDETDTEESQIAAHVHQRLQH